MATEPDRSTVPQDAVVWPLGRSTRTEIELSPRWDDPDGRRIGFVWNHLFRGDEMFKLLSAELQRTHPSMTFVPFEAFGNIHGENEREVLDGLEEQLRTHRVDAVIAGVGA